MQTTIRGLALAILSSGFAMAHGISQAAECDASAGQQVFQTKCSACHALDESRVGPKLAAVVGRPIGSVPGFTYTAGLAVAKSTWNVEQLDQFLTAPAKKFPETAMAFGGLRKAEERQAVLCFLQTKS
ncbi:cytochrome C [Pseudomonas laurylsulfatiphila]|uniref:Cytochrome C n=1 Tax=Pseudomonas laurylsulfatiphila TaxID=2011015 RepID=A0A2S6FCE9_9PSED|nr:c-type cytochrome [Pseudomonas laurylsulfatiphila]PPK35107.1 cytochrome C [Pseudomonas laurylsulfatiphila]